MHREIPVEEEMTPLLPEDPAYWQVLERAYQLGGSMVACVEAATCPYAHATTQGRMTAEGV